MVSDRVGWRSRHRSFLPIKGLGKTKPVRVCYLLHYYRSASDDLLQGIGIGVG